MKLCRIGSSDALIPLCGALLFVTLLGATFCFAQRPDAPAAAGSSSIAGKVTAAAGEGRNNPLSGVTVKLTAATPNSAVQTAVADSEGRYEFTRLPAGKYTLKAAHRKAGVVTQEVEVKEGEPAKVALTLEAK